MQQDSNTRNGEPGIHPPIAQVLVQASDIALIRRMIDAAVQHRHSAPVMHYIDQQESAWAMTRELHYDLLVQVVDTGVHSPSRSQVEDHHCPVLIVTSDAAPADRYTWLSQGASDCVSLNDNGLFDLVLNRLLDTCNQQRAQQIDIEQLSMTEHLAKQLLDHLPQPALLLQQGRIIGANQLLDEQILHTHNTIESRQTSWDRWLSATARQALSGVSKRTTQHLSILDRFGQFHRMRITSLDNASTTSPLADTSLVVFESAGEDSVTGLLGREALLGTWQRWIDSLQTGRRYIAMMISLPGLHGESGSKSINNTLQDLLAFRAADVLAETFASRAIIGRPGERTLLLVLDTNSSGSRYSALTVRALLGSLGGLVDDPASITIKTLTLSPHALTAAAVLQRLEGTTQPPIKSLQRFKPERADALCAHRAVDG